MADSVAQEIIAVLLKTSGIGDAVRGRISDEHPFSKTQPEFPSILIRRAGEGETHKYFPGAAYSLMLTVCSTISSDEAVGLHANIAAVLHQQRFSRSGTSFVLWKLHPPVTTIDDTGALVYMAHVSYEVQSVGP
jgi:hypothetical protein